jgi:hypothetical protein
MLRKEKQKRLKVVKKPKVMEVMRETRHQEDAAPMLHRQEEVDHAKKKRLAKKSLSPKKRDTKKRDTRKKGTRKKRLPKRRGTKRNQKGLMVKTPCKELRIP